MEDAKLCVFTGYLVANSLRYRIELRRTHVILLGRRMGLLFQAIEVTQGDCNAHGVGAGKYVGLVVRKNVGQAVIETPLK